MNFLAHIYLSGSIEEVQIGNFIGDFVKGKDYLKFSEGVQKGILLHRYIDQFTDSHSVVLKGKIRLRKQFGHYSPVISDIYFDHFLAKNWDQYSSIPLLPFTHHFFNTTDKWKEILPDKANHMLSFMKPQNWLYNYQHIEGIHRALSGMSRRSKFDTNMENAAEFLKGDYASFESEFFEFFPELIEESTQYLNKL
jgi:acyl carrier protein phosphodiesterase